MQILINFIETCLLGPVHGAPFTTSDQKPSEAELWYVHVIHVIYEAEKSRWVLPKILGERG